MPFEKNFETSCHRYFNTFVCSEEYYDDLSQEIQKIRHTADFSINLVVDPEMEHHQVRLFYNTLFDPYREHAKKFENLQSQELLLIIHKIQSCYKLQKEQENIKDINIYPLRKSCKIKWKRKVIDILLDENDDSYKKHPNFESVKTGVLSALQGQETLPVSRYFLQLLEDSLAEVYLLKEKGVEGLAFCTDQKNDLET